MYDFTNLNVQKIPPKKLQNTERYVSHPPWLFRTNLSSAWNGLNDDVKGMSCDLYSSRQLTACSTHICNGVEGLRIHFLRPHTVAAAAAPLVPSGLEMSKVSVDVVVVPRQDGNS